MKSIESTVRIALATAAVAGSLAGCTSKFKEGDKGIAPQDIVVVTDYNVPNVRKPTCTIHKGDSVEITGFSTLNLGSSEKQGLIELTTSDCKGYVFDDMSLNDDIDIK